MLYDLSVLFLMRTMTYSVVIEDVFPNSSMVTVVTLVPASLVGGIVYPLGSSLYDVSVLVVFVWLLTTYISVAAVMVVKYASGTQTYVTVAA